MIRTMSVGLAHFGRFAKQHIETESGPDGYIGRHRAIELPAAQQRITVPAVRPGSVPPRAGIEQVSGTAVIA